MNCPYCNHELEVNLMPTPSSHLRITIDRITQVVSQYHHLHKSAIISASRRGPVVKARFQAMWIARKAGYPLMTIAHYFGKKEHTSIIHAVNKVNQCISIYEDDREQIRQLMEICGQHYE